MAYIRKITDKIIKFKFQGMLQTVISDTLVSHTFSTARILLSKEIKAICTILTSEIYSSDSINAVEKYLEMDYDDIQLLFVLLAEE